MGRPKKSAPASIDPKFESQDIPEEGPAGVIETEAAAGAEGDSPSKSEAARQAIKSGYEKPGLAVGWIKQMFGIDMNPQHFSAIKSNYRKAQAESKPAKGKPGRGSKEAPSQAVEGYLAPPPKQAEGRGDARLIEALEAMKPLVASLGADKVKRLVDLLG